MWGQTDLRCSLTCLKMSHSKSCLENHMEIFTSWRYWGQKVRSIPKIKGTNTLSGCLGHSSLLQPPFCNSGLQPQDANSSLQRGFHNSLAASTRWIDLECPAAPCSDHSWWKHLGQPGQHMPNPWKSLVLSDPGHSVTSLSFPFQPCLGTWLTDRASHPSLLCVAHLGFTGSSQGPPSCLGVVELPPKIHQIPWKNGSSPAVWCFCASPVPVHVLLGYPHRDLGNSVNTCKLFFTKQSLSLCADAESLYLAWEK